MSSAPPTPQQTANSQYVLLTALVIISWELLVHFFQDWEYLRMKGWYRRPVLWAYFIQRYGAFAVVVAQANIRLGTPPSCYAAGMVSLTVGGVLVLPSISLIYLFRVLAIWNKKREVKYTLIFLWVVLLGASMTAPFSQTAANLSNGKCTVTRSEAYTPASFIANTVFDTCVFVLTLFKLGVNRPQYKNFYSPVQSILLRDGVLYFAVSAVVGIVTTVFLEAIKTPVVASTIIPLHIALTSVMTTRLVNNVFQIATDGYTGTRLLFDTRVSGDVWRRNTTGATSGGLRSSQRGRMVQDAAATPTITIGSGVGTDRFDEDTKVQPRDLEGSEVGYGAGKGLTGSLTYAIPMELRSPTSPSSGTLPTFGIHIETERVVTRDGSTT